MRALAAFAAWLLLAVAPAGAEELAGRVAGVYQQAAPGVLVAAKLGGGRGDRWVDVELGDGRSVLARVPDEMQVAPGQRIAVRVGDRKSSALAQALPTTAVSRVLSPDPSASVGR